MSTPASGIILTIGSEIVDGRIQDTNSRYIASALAACGFPVVAIHSCADSQAAILDALQFSCSRARFVIISGGLGPTSDDITRNVVADFSGNPLELNKNALSKIKSYFEQRGRPFEDTNICQAEFPKGSTAISNPVGTAPGFELPVSPENSSETLLFCLPGVPKELQAMYESYVEPRLQAAYPGHDREEFIAMQTFGVSESVAASRIQALSLSNSFKVSYRASFPVLKLRVVSNGDANLSQALSSLRQNIGDEYIFVEDDVTPLPEILLQLLVKNEMTLALAESCTGGQIGALIAGVPGASAHFMGSAVTYSNEAKVNLLDVPSKIIDQFGAVSHETAASMAAGSLLRYSSDIAAAVTGIAGPDGGSDQKPVGTFYLGLAAGDLLHSYRFFFSGSRTAVQRYAAFMALDLIRRHLLNQPLTTLSIEDRSFQTGFSI